MNVRVEVNNVDVSDKVIQYSREHKICSGIGNLTIEFTYAMFGEIDPWDTIDIYENGDLAMRYFASTITDNQPNPTITVEAQDNSKRLSDYFIPDSYLIDYPSYTRYWIEFFLDEVGITPVFLTDSSGSLLSNNTSLGLVTAYEQIMMLLQMSGWYMTFTPMGNCQIGELTADFGSTSDNLDDHDITEFKMVMHDKMLRNRVVVWGNGDPTTARWVFAEVIKPTRWDYDENDRRTIVISNSNIPNVSSAFLLANQAITEFAKITVEKYITAIDARPIMVGDIIRVRNPIFTGKGLVTTFGTTMSKDGLISNIVLDERCPRLFGFFNPGGRVYVGFYGDGVWRKHIQYFSSGWMNYSSGLSTLEITDLHVNGGVLSSVGSSGQAFYSIEDDTPWLQVPFSGFQVIYSGAPVEETVYSGLMTRACIIDRTTNNVRFAVDTRSGLNIGDFLSETTPIGVDGLGGGMITTLSGIAAVSGLRSWIADISPYSGSVLNVYPIHISGTYDVCVFDIENDGVTDYVSVASIGSGAGIPTLSGLYDFGYRNNTSNFSTGSNRASLGIGDSRISTAFNSDATFIDTDSYAVGDVGAGAIINYPFSIFNNTIVGDRDLVWFHGATRTLRRNRVEANDFPPPALDIASSVSSTLTSQDYCYMIKKVSQDKYAAYTSDTALSPRTFKKYVWDVANSTLTPTTIGTKTITYGTYETVYINYVAVGTKIYFSVVYVDTTTTVTSFKVEIFNIDTDSDVIGDSTTIFNTNDLLDDLPPEITGHTVYVWSQGPFIFPYKEGYQILIPYEFKYDDFVNTVPPEVTHYYQKIKRFHYAVGGPSVIQTDGIMLEAYKVHDPYGVPPDTGGIYASMSKYANRQYSAVLNDDKCLFTFSPNTNDDPILYPDKIVGTTGFFDRIIDDEGAIPFEIDTDYTTSVKGIYGIFGRFDDRYIAYNPANSKFYECSSVNLSAQHEQTVPTSNIELLGPFNMRDSVTNEVYWTAHDNDTFTNRIVAMLPQAPGSFGKNFNFPISEVTGEVFGLNGGNFFILSNGDYAYFDNTNPPMAGLAYYVLRRDNEDYTVLYSGGYEQRLDISLYTPLVIMDRRIASVQTFYTSADGGYTTSTHMAMSGYNLGSGIATSGSLFTLGTIADDFRYSDFEHVVYSGLDVTVPESGTSRDLLVVYTGCVGSLNLYTLDSFSGLWLSPSGQATRIEASNFFMPDQYVFLTVSGYNYSGVAPDGWGFYQKNPSGMFFMDQSSGFPQTRPTIIRLDDKL